MGYANAPLIAHLNCCAAIIVLSPSPVYKSVDAIDSLFIGPSTQGIGLSLSPRQALIQKRLEEVFLNYQFILVKASSVPDTQELTAQLTQYYSNKQNATIATAPEKEGFIHISKVTLPKSALNTYIATIDWPITGCNVELIGLQQQSKISPNQEVFPQNTGLCPAYLGDKSLDLQHTIWNSTNDKALGAFEKVVNTNQITFFLNCYIESSSNNMPLNRKWHMNQLLGAFSIVRSLDGRRTPTFISSSELKQCLIVQQNMPGTPKQIVALSVSNLSIKLDTTLAEQSAIMNKLLQLFILIVQAVNTTRSTQISQ